MDRQTTLKKVLEKIAAQPGGKRRKRVLPEAYTDYGRSLYSQQKGDPTASGLLRGLGYAALGGSIGGGTAALAGLDKEKAAATALIGALIGGVSGYHSGKSERESENTRLLFLRRLGINTPGELEAMTRYPDLGGRMTEKGVSI